MTVLSDGEILDLVDRGFLIKEGFSAKSLTPNGYDVRIGKVMYDGMTMETCTISASSSFYASSIEYFSLPDDIMGEIWIRSSYSRKGIIGSFGAIDAGFVGNLTFFFLNAGAAQVELKSGDRIAQIVFHKLSDKAALGYGGRSGNYQFSKGIRLNSNGDVKNGE